MVTEAERANTKDLEACPGCGHPNGVDARFCSACGLQLVREGEGEHATAGSVADPLIGRTIADRYHIQALVGRGGMGVVYKVEHVHIGKLMAMKLLHGELSRDRDTVRRFKREAEAASHLSHPNTVQIFDFGRDQGLMYLVMELIDGRDLSQVIQAEGELSMARTARICAQVCASVAEAHAKGIIHRDLKPENVMITETSDRPDLVKVLDFGLAKLRDADMTHSLTRAGAIVGTPYYMAPEHIRGEGVDPRTDVYSVGAMMYKALTGVPPFWANSPMGVLTKHLTDEVVPPRDRSANRNLPPEADAIVLRALEKDPSARYQSMDELRRDLALYLSSVGERLDDASLRFPSGAPGLTASGRQARVPVATRVDVDLYERRIKRKSWGGGLLALMFLTGLAAGGWYLWTENVPEAVPTAEREPNDLPSQATALPPGTPLDGMIGKRQNEQSGDADVYRIQNPGGERRTVTFGVTPLPNMDLVVEVVRAGTDQPSLVVDSGGVGEGERVPNFPLAGSTYYLRVREKWVEGAYPTENVSDAYVIAWDFVDAAPDGEREINDSLELADEIGVNDQRRGHIGWRGDLDTYCLREDAAAVVAEVGPVPGMDMVLRVVDRGAAVSRKVDRQGLGEGESSGTIGPARAGETCFEVSADASGGAPSNAEQTYILQVRPADDEADLPAGVGFPDEVIR